MKKNFYTETAAFFARLDSIGQPDKNFPIQKIAEELTGILQLQDEGDVQENTRLMGNAKEKKLFLSQVDNWISSKNIRSSVRGEIFHMLVDKCINLYDFLLAEEKIHRPYPNNIQQLKLRQEDAFKLMEGKYPFSFAPLGYTLDRKTSTLFKNKETADDITELLEDYVATGEVTTEESFLQKCAEHTPPILTKVIVEKLFDKEGARLWLLFAGCLRYPTHGIYMPIPYTTSPHISLASLWQIIQHIYSEEKQWISYTAYLKKYSNYISYLHQHHADRWKETKQENIDFLDNYISKDDNEIPNNLIPASKSKIPQEYILNVKQANAFFQDNNYESALALYQEADIIYPNQPFVKQRIEEIQALQNQTGFFKKATTEVSVVELDAEIPADIVVDLKMEDDFNEEEENPLADGEDSKKQKRKGKKNKK